MASLTAAQREFLQRPFAAALTTIRPDGSPHTTVVWADLDDEGIYFNTAAGRFKERNMRRDPRVSLLMVDPEDAYRWISVSGPVELTTEGADHDIDRLAKKYLGADSYPFRKAEEQRVSVRLTPERIDSTGLDS